VLSLRTFSILKWPEKEGDSSNAENRLKLWLALNNEREVLSDFVSKRKTSHEIRFFIEGMKPPFAILPASTSIDHCDNGGVGLRPKSGARSEIPKKILSGQLSVLRPMGRLSILRPIGQLSILRPMGQLSIFRPMGQRSILPPIGRRTRIPRPICTCDGPEGLCAYRDGLMSQGHDPSSCDSSDSSIYGITSTECDCIQDSPTELYCYGSEGLCAYIDNYVLTVSFQRKKIPSVPLVSPVLHVVVANHLHKSLTV